MIRKFVVYHGLFKLFLEYFRKCKNKHSICIFLQNSYTNEGSYNFCACHAFFRLESLTKKTGEIIKKLDLTEYLNLIIII